MIASRNDAKEDATKSAIFLHVAGQEALEIYNMFIWETVGDEKKLTKIVEKFKSYCTPRKARF